MENSEEIKQFIKEHSALFWYIPEEKKENISNELIIESVLNYGQLDDIKKLFKLIDINTVSLIFNNLKERQKMNYYPEIYNYFKLYFNKYAQKHTK